MHLARNAKLKQHGPVFKGLDHELIINVVIIIVKQYLSLVYN